MNCYNGFCFKKLWQFLKPFWIIWVRVSKAASNSTYPSSDLLQHLSISKLRFVPVDGSGVFNLNFGEFRNLDTQYFFPLRSCNDDTSLKFFARLLSKFVVILRNKTFNAEKVTLWMKLYWHSDKKISLRCRHTPFWKLSVIQHM